MTNADGTPWEPQAAGSNPAAATLAAWRSLEARGRKVSSSFVVMALIGLSRPRRFPQPDQEGDG